MCVSHSACAACGLCVRVRTVCCVCSVCSMCCIVLFCVVRMRVWCRKVVPACVCAIVVLIVLCVCACVSCCTCVVVVGVCVIMLSFVSFPYLAPARPPCLCPSLCFRLVLPPFAVLVVRFRLLPSSAVADGGDRE